MGHEEWSSRKGIFNFANVNLALNLVHCKGQRFWNFMPDLLHYSSSSKKPKIQHLQSGYLEFSFWRKVLFNPFYFLAKSNFFGVQHVLNKRESPIEFDSRDFECQGESEWKEKHLHMLLSNDLSEQQMQLEIFWVIWKNKSPQLSCHL